ncbi:MAG: SH3 domain-containing protein, partial [Gemmatimonadetes bacterium]|nr:SH3 domain-containing protein [Gemmatimonadota bacterium]
IGRGRFSAGDVSRRAGEISFAVPLRLETVRNSNVRDGPGRGSKVLFTVRERTPLVGLAYEGQWVRIRDDQGRGGWVFHSLVRSRPRHP